MKGYRQIPIADEDVRKTTVLVTPFPRTLFGLKNAGLDFQRLMNKILGNLTRIYVYVDNLLVASETLEQLTNCSRL